MKINPKYSPYLFAFFMGASMGIVMSFLITAINVGFTQDFLFRWLKAFGIGASVGIPTAVLVSPFIAKLVNRLINHEPKP
jgi:hypothetical protein